MSAFFGVTERVHVRYVKIFRHGSNSFCDGKNSHEIGALVYTRTRTIRLLIIIVAEAAKNDHMVCHQGAWRQGDLQYSPLLLRHCCISYSLDLLNATGKGRNKKSYNPQ